MRNLILLVIQASQDMAVAAASIVFIICFLKQSDAFETNPNCWLGNEEFSVDLICPEYTGTGEIFCCGQPHNR